MCSSWNQSSIPEPERPGVRAREVLKRFGSEPLRGAEVGVFKAQMSAELLRQHPHLTLYLIDCRPKSQQFTGTQFAKDRRIILHMDSLDAAEEIPDHSLDFAFLDADHTAQAVRADIVAWGYKIKPGGWLCGHDYDKENGSCPGVTKAVDEYVARSKKPLELGDDTTWFVQL